MKPYPIRNFKKTLLGIAKSKNWTYKLYEEVASGEKIESRKEMQKLLHHVEDRLYDGVLVMDIDRLGRHEHKDWALIKDTFLHSETLIITPNKIYDLEKDNDDVSHCGGCQIDIGMTVKFYTVAELVMRLGEAKRSGTLERLMNEIQPPNSLSWISGDMCPLTARARNCCFAL